MSRGIHTETTLYLERDGDEVEAIVAGTVHPARRASRHEPASADVDDIRVLSPAGLVLTDAEDERAYEALRGRHEDDDGDED